MIYKISCSMIFICLIIAVLLALVGIHQVNIGQPFYTFFNEISILVSQNKVEIPDIPKLEPISNRGEWWVTLINGLYNFFNVFIVLINGLITIINVVITLFEFFYFFISRFRVFIEVLKQSAVA